jgi:lipoyl(octanoyl) transferase
MTSTDDAQSAIRVQDLGLMAYEEALAVQRSLNQAVIDGDAEPTLLFVEHPPVITLTRRSGPNLLASETQLADLGVAIAQTDRGGDITYHGPGQLVAYPILKLGDLGLNLSSYMRLLERVVIDTLAHWGIAGHNECGATGVWVHHHGLAGDAQRRTPNDRQSNDNAKICAMGVRIRKNTTLHGLALNVAPDMSHFGLIVPCGLQGRPVTSMRQILGDACPSIDQVKERLIAAMFANLSDADQAARCAIGSARGKSAES